MTGRRFAITVDFDVKLEHYDLFMRLMSENAKASVRDEPGCIRFDVMTSSRGDKNRIFLYEIYESEAAFADHLRTTHFQAFDKATASMIRSKTIGSYFVAENAKEQV